MSEPVAYVSTWPIREGQGEGGGSSPVFRSDRQRLREDEPAWTRYRGVSAPRI